MKFIAGNPKGEKPAQFVFDTELDGLREQAKANNFTGKEREILVLYPGKPAKRLIVAGLGRKDKFTTEKLRRAAALVGQRARALDLADISVVPPAGDAAEN